MSSSGGKSGKGPVEGTKDCGTLTIPLVLFIGNIDVESIPNRDWGTFMPVDNIFNGQAERSTSSLYSNIDKNYCHITITSTTCSNYGNGGTKSFVWDSTNDGYNDDSAMNIEIPADGSFTITIDIHEACGPWYSGSQPYKRAMWIHQGTYYPTSVITITTWSLNRVDNC